MNPNLDYGKMNKREIHAANTIAMSTIGNHFSPAVGKYLIKLIEAHTCPEGR